MLFHCFRNKNPKLFRGGRVGIEQRMDRTGEDHFPLGLILSLDCFSNETQSAVHDGTLQRPHGGGEGYGGAGVPVESPGCPAKIEVTIELVALRCVLHPKTSLRIQVEDVFLGTTGEFGHGLPVLGPGCIFLFLHNAEVIRIRNGSRRDRLARTGSKLDGIRGGRVEWMLRGPARNAPILEARGMDFTPVFPQTHNPQFSLLQTYSRDSLDGLGEFDIH